MNNRPLKNIVSLTGRYLFGLIIMLSIFANMSSKTLAVDYPKLPNRSLTIGNYYPGATTTYTIAFSYPAPTTIGSIRFLMCTDGEIGDTCTSPGGDLSTADLVVQTGATGFVISSQNANEILITRPSAAMGAFPTSYQFSNVTNPSTVQEQFYIRIQTYASSDGSGTLNHGSSVVSAITEPIVINTEVPPILYFCAAVTIDMWCENPAGNFVNYNTLSSITGNAATSQFGVATNALGGYTVRVYGNTMTSGFKTIPATTVPSGFTPGTPQFGINLRANTNPAVGAEPVGLGISTVDPDYDTPDVFQFINGDVVASAFTGTMFDIFTVTYIVNVPPDQPAGVYSTTIAYICTAAF